jgi:hypothetical protein
MAAKLKWWSVGNRRGHPKKHILLWTHYLWDACQVKIENQWTISERFAIFPYFSRRYSWKSHEIHWNSGNSVGIHGRYSRKPMKITWISWKFCWFLFLGDANHSQETIRQDQPLGHNPPAVISVHWHLVHHDSSAFKLKEDCWLRFSWSLLCFVPVCGFHVLLDKGLHVICGFVFFASQSWSRLTFLLLEFDVANSFRRTCLPNSSRDGSNSWISTHEQCSKPMKLWGFIAPHLLGGWSLSKTSWFFETHSFDPQPAVIVWLLWACLCAPKYASGAVLIFEVSCLASS